MKNFLTISGIVAAFVVLGVGIYGYFHGKGEDFIIFIVAATIIAIITGIFYCEANRGR